MEKQKLQPGPKPRVKRVLPPPGDFIPLGKSSSSKPRAGNESDIKPSQPVIRKPTIGTAPHVATGQKRKEASPVNAVGAKQTRTFSPSFARAGKEKSLDVSQTLPSVKVIDAQPAQLEQSVLAAFTKGDMEQTDGLLCGAIRTMKMNRLKPDAMIYLTMVSLAKQCPQMFSSKRVTEHLLQFLRRENTIIAVKPKPNTLLSVMTCNILLHAYQNEHVWPQSFIKAYVEDALGDRAWVDNEHNKDFVGNITKVFATVLPQKNTSTTKAQSTGDAASTMLVDNTSAATAVKGEEEKIMEEVGISLEAEEPALIRNRYMMHKDEIAVQSYIYDVVKEQLNKRQMIDSVSRNTLRFLTAVCGYVEVRLLASQKIETWLQNPKLTRPTQELLISVILNCNTHTTDDVEVINNLVKMRLKGKLVANHYINCMKELLNQHPDNLGTTLKRVIYNELNQQRNPNNMSILAAMFSSYPQTSARHLAAVFQELCCYREDYLRAIRALFREIVKSLKYEMNLVEFCLGMMQERREAIFTELEQPLKERMFASVIDLINLACFLCVSPAVKEQAAALSKGESRDFSLLHSFQMQISAIQTDAVWFFHTKVKSMYNCSEKDFVAGLNRILFVEPAETYSQKDNWPPDAERNNLLQLVTEVPLSGDSLLRLHILGISEDTPLNLANTLDIVEKIVYRSAVLMSGLQGIKIEKTDVITMLLNLPAYAHPKEIALPSRYIAPCLAITNLFWKSWLVLLVLAATNPSTIGIEVWNSYPTARCMMEMLITGCYVFPPFPIDGTSPDDIKAHELQISRVEKEEILVFEGHLAAATSGQVITEGNSRLIDKLVKLDPSGAARQPPDSVIEELKVINEKYKLGKLLCQCREPDFLLFIIQNQDSSKSMPWLADLVQSSESSLSALPLQCLCEFLLMKHQPIEHGQQNKLRSIKSKVAAQLQDLLIGTKANKHDTLKLVQYFISRWSSRDFKEREAAVFGFKTIVLHHKKSKRANLVEEDEAAVADPPVTTSLKKQLEDLDSYDWLHKQLVTYPFIEDVMPLLLTAVIQALLVEMNAARIRAYMLFVNKHYESLDDSYFNLLIGNLSRLLTTRKTVVDSLLDVGTEGNARDTYNSLLLLFVTYVKLNFERGINQANESLMGEHLQVTWKNGSRHSGQAIIVHSMFVSASLVLLTHGKLLDDSPLPKENFDYLSKLWLPVSSYTFTDCHSNQTKSTFMEWNVRLLMVQCGIEELVAEVLKDAEVRDLLNLLKSSGIDLRTKEKILKSLDDQCTKQSKIIANTTPDNDYILKMVFLAKRQGVKSGDKFYEILKSGRIRKQLNDLSLHKPPTQQVLVGLNETKRLLESERPRNENVIAPAHIEEILRDAFERKQTDSFRTLKQQLSKENIIGTESSSAGLSECVLECLLSSCKRSEFFNGFCASKESSTLLRILSFSKAVKSTEKFRTVLRLLNSHSTEKNDFTKTIQHLSQANGLKLSDESVKKSLSVLLEEIIRATTNDQLSHTIKAFLTEFKSSVRHQAPPKQSLVKAGLRILQDLPGSFESFVTCLCTNASDQRDVKFTVEVLVELLKAGNQSTTGVIVDRITLLDPEVLQLNPILLRELLFTNDASTVANEVSSSSSSSLSREQNNSTMQNSLIPAVSYLSSLVAHQARNSTLQDCVQWILSSTRSCESFNAGACLDFLSTMIYNPRLWQGRESKQQDDSLSLDKSKDQVIEEAAILELPMQQVYHLVQLILTELSSTMKEKGNNEKMEVLMDKRLCLLFNVTRSVVHLQKAINIIKQTKRFPDDIFQCFLKYLYMKRPTLCNLSKEITCVAANQTLPTNNKMEMDLIIHRLIMCISEPGGAVDCAENFRSISAIHRRIAVHHPFAFMRQLPLLLSLMKGKNRMTSAIFKWTDQLALCNHVFDLFDLLRPHVFNTDQNSKEIMTVFIEVFLELIYAPGLKINKAAKFIARLAEFLTRYIASGNKDAGSLLREHERVFRELLYDFPNFHDLTTVVTYISTFDETANSQTSLVSTATSPWNDVQLKSFKRGLSMNHHDRDILGVLRELEEKRRTSILQFFMDEFSMLVLSGNQEIRELAHELVLRCCKENPRDASSLHDIYMNCLNTSNPDVIECCAKYASQGILLCNERSDALMMRLYDVAVTSRLQIDTHIKQAVKSFNVDYDA